MRKDEFLDVMGEIDDKFFKEAEEYLCGDYGEIVEPVIIQPKKKSAARFVLPIAASVALVGVLGIAVFFGGRINTTDPNAVISSDITTRVPEETTEDSTENNEELPEEAEKAISINSDYAWAMGKSFDEVTEKFGAGTEDRYISYRFENCSGIFSFEHAFNGDNPNPILGNCRKILYIKAKDFLIGEFTTLGYEELEASCGIKYVSLPESNDGLNNLWHAIFTHPNYKDIVFYVSTVERDVIDETTIFGVDYSADYYESGGTENAEGEKAISINSDYAWAMGKSFDEVTKKFGTGTIAKYGSYRFENRSGIFSLENTFNGVDYDPIHSICKKILYIKAEDFLIGEFSTMNYEEFAESCGIEYISLPESNDTMDNTWNAIFTHPDYKDIVFIVSTVERDVIDETADFMIDYSVGYSGLEGAENETGATSSENAQRVVPQKTVTVGPSTVSFTDRYPEIPKPNFNEEFFTEMTALELCEYYGLTMVKEYLKTGDFIEITDENTRHGVYNLPDGNVYDINTFTFETPDNIIREKRVTLTVGKKSFFGQEFFPETEYGTGKIKYDDYYNENEEIFFKIFEKNGLCMMVSAKVDEIADFDDPKLKELFYNKTVHEVDEEFWQGVPPEYHFFAQAVYECSRTDT